MDVQKTFAQALTELLARYANEPTDELIEALEDALWRLALVKEEPVGEVGEELILGMENAVAHARGQKRAGEEK